MCSRYSEQRGETSVWSQDARTNFDYAGRMKQIEIAAAKSGQEENTSDLLSLLYIGVKAKEEVECALSGAQNAKYHRQIEDVRAKPLQNMTAVWRAEQKAQNKEIITIWIYSPAGTRKTSLAKEYVKEAERTFIYQVQAGIYFKHTPGNTS